MRIPAPIVISTQTDLRFLIPVGGKPRVLLDGEDDDFTLPTMQGGRSRMPTIETMRTICMLNRNAITGRPLNPEALDLFGSNLNNLGALLILEGRANEALEVLREGDQQFQDIGSFFRRPVPEALLGIATLAYNASLLGPLDGRPAYDFMLDIASDAVGSVPTGSRGRAWQFMNTAILMHSVTFDGRPLEFFAPGVPVEEM